MNANYWWQNIREPVRFDTAIDALITRGINVFVEVGPHAVLRNYVSDCLRHLNTAGACVGAVEGGATTPHTLFVVENLETRGSILIARIEDEAMRVDDCGRPKVLTVGPEHRA